MTAMDALKQELYKVQNEMKILEGSYGYISSSRRYAYLELVKKARKIQESIELTRSMVCDH